jgi:hypothetical protein
MLYSFSESFVVHGVAGLVTMVAMAGTPSAQVNA